MSVKEIPRKLLYQLAEGGRLIVPVDMDQEEQYPPQGKYAKQKMIVIDKSDDGETIDIQYAMDVNYPPLREEQDQKAL